MPRKPSPEQEQAKRLYLDSNGQMLLKDIADAIGKSAEQVRKWKSTGKWDDELKGNVTKSKGNVTKRRESTKSGLAPPAEEDQTDEHDIKDAELTPKQRHFVKEYLVDLNATQAAIRSGYSPKSAHSIGEENLRKPEVRSAIEKALAARAERVQLNADWVLKRLVRLADYDLRDFANLATVRRIFVTKSGDPLEDEIQTVVLNPDFDGTIAKSLYQDKDGIKLDMPDRVRALELIGKHIGLFTDPHRVRIDYERLQLDRERLEIERAKHGNGEDGSGGVQLIDDIGSDHHAAD